MQLSILRKKIRIPKKYRLLIWLLPLVIFVVSACVSSITSINQPDSVNAGDSVHITLGIQWKEVNYERMDRQVIGICVPKSWHAAQNMRMYVSGDLGSSSMSLVPAGTLEPDKKIDWPTALMQKFGIGPNLIDDMEWVVFWSDNKFHTYNGTTANGTVTIAIKTSTDNLKFKPGYVMCDDEDGLSDYFSGYYTSAFGNCLEAVNGDGDIEDFCNPQIGLGEPPNATDNDIITLKYNANLDTSDLKNASDIYLCAKAFTDTGDSIEVCNQNENTKLVNWDRGKYRIDFWPRKFFNLPDNQHLTKIEYYFTNSDGSLKTGYANTADPFVYTFRCK